MNCFFTPIGTFLNKFFFSIFMEKDSLLSTYYDLELDKLVEEVNAKNFSKVVLQFPDGLKYYAREVLDVLEARTKAQFFVYFGTCFGACDVPLHLKELDFDLCVQWGHSVYVKTKGMW